MWSGGAWHGMKDGGKGGAGCCTAHQIMQTRFRRGLLCNPSRIRASGVCTCRSVVDLSEGGNDGGGGVGVQQCHGERLTNPPGLGRPRAQVQPTIEGRLLACTRLPERHRSHSAAASNWRARRGGGSDASPNRGVGGGGERGDEKCILLRVRLWAELYLTASSVFIVGLKDLSRRR